MKNYIIVILIIELMLYNTCIGAKLWICIGETHEYQMFGEEPFGKPNSISKYQKTGVFLITDFQQQIAIGSYPPCLYLWTSKEQEYILNDTLDIKVSLKDTILYSSSADYNYKIYTVADTILKIIITDSDTLYYKYLKDFVSNKSQVEIDDNYIISTLVKEKWFWADGLQKENLTNKSNKKWLHDILYYSLFIYDKRRKVLIAKDINQKGKLWQERKFKIIKMYGYIILFMYKKVEKRKPDYYIISNRYGMTYGTVVESAHVQMLLISKVDKDAILIQGGVIPFSRFKLLEDSYLFLIY